MRIIGFLIFWITRVRAEDARSILQDEHGNGLSEKKLRSGDIHMEDIPGTILAIINNLLDAVAYISLFAILIGSLMYILAGAKEDFKNKGKEAIKMALIGSVIAWSAWIVVNFFTDNI